MESETKGWNKKLWFWLFLAVWAVFAAAMLFYKWKAIYWFALSDTDDNMRMSQVRAWLNGQGWYDLRQYKLNPPAGANIHWSRLVDMPIAGLILLFRPLFGGLIAEKIAVAAAPLIALGPALWGMMLASRRLMPEWSALLAVAILACAETTLFMWMPLRIDHHGWQLAFLILMVAGAVDPKPVRSGVTIGLTSAASLVIGLEFLPYLAVTGATLVLRWILNREQEAERLKAYGISLAAATAIGFALFASNDNRVVTCDALSPVYLSAMLVAGAAGVVLASLPLQGWKLRTAAALVAGAMIAIAFVIAWPECLGRPERISPELDQLWFQYINEAKPLWGHKYKTWAPTIALPVIGVIGTILATVRHRRGPSFAAWLSVLALSLASCGLLMWQTRVGPAAQLLSVLGATWLGAQIMPRTQSHSMMLVRVFGTVAAFMVVSGLAVSFGVQAIPEKPKKESRKVVDKANARCPTLPALHPIALMPAQTILTHVDFGPRLITVTHHRAIAGPYHRNGPAILDVLHSFRSSDPEVAHSVMRRHGATLLLLCPGMSETTIYAAESPKGFYKQLMRGQVPNWLAPVPLPASSPFRLWRRTD